MMPDDPDDEAAKALQGYFLAILVKGVWSLGYPNAQGRGFSGGSPLGTYIEQSTRNYKKMQEF